MADRLEGKAFNGSRLDALREVRAALAHEHSEDLDHRVTRLEGDIAMFKRVLIDWATEPRKD